MQLLGTIQAHVSGSIQGQLWGAPTPTKADYISAAVGTRVTQGGVTAHGFQQECRKWSSAGNINIQPWHS